MSDELDGKTACNLEVGMSISAPWSPASAP